MKRLAYRILFTVFVVLTTLTSYAPNLKAQTLPDLVKEMNIDVLTRDYLRPAVDAVGYSIKSGYVHSANVDSTFHIWIGAKVMMTFIPDHDKTFVAKLPQFLVEAGYPAEVTTATVVGDPNGGALLTSNLPEEGDIQLPGGTGLDRSFMALPQLTIGPLLGTDIIVRGLPFIKFNTELGDISFYGAALKHEITHWFESPIDVAVLAGFQRFHLTDYIDGNSLNGMLIAGKDLGIVTLFGGVGYESYHIEVGYQPDDPINDQDNISLDFQRRNLRFTVGSAVKILPLLDITAEYSFGEMDNLTFGLGIWI